tara:strand:+ start:1371 stop:1640 length:270 start_codon:yes stop_codon:yes gene_type:complete
MTVNTQERLPIKHVSTSSARLSSDELNVLEKLGQDVVTINLDITLKPVTWIALQKYALKNDCSLSTALESGLEESDQVASAIDIRQSER